MKFVMIDLHGDRDMAEKELNPLIKMIIANNYTGEIPPGAESLAKMVLGIGGVVAAAGVGAALPAQIGSLGQIAHNMPNTGPTAAVEVPTTGGRSLHT